VRPKLTPPLLPLLVPPTAVNDVGTCGETGAAPAGGSDNASASTLASRSRGAGVAEADCVISRSELTFLSLIIAAVAGVDTRSTSETLLTCRKRPRALCRLPLAPWPFAALLELASVADDAWRIERAGFGEASPASRAPAAAATLDVRSLSLPPELAKAAQATVEPREEDVPTRPPAVSSW